MYKPRVIFPHIESGAGYAEWYAAICDAFEKKYGEYTVTIRADFCDNKKPLKRLGKTVKGRLKRYNHPDSFGYSLDFLAKIFGTKITCRLAYNANSETKRAAIDRLEGLDPDVIVSLHPLVNYFAGFMDKTPLRVTYIADSCISVTARCDCELVLAGSKRLVSDAIEKYSDRFNENNLKFVRFPVSERLIKKSKQRNGLRRKFGLENEFVIALDETGCCGGKLIEFFGALSRSDIKATVIVLGDHADHKYKAVAHGVDSKVKLYETDQSVKPVDYIAASDLVVSANGVRSDNYAAMMGIPQLSVGCKSFYEKSNAQFFIKKLGCGEVAEKIEDAVKIVREFCQNEQAYAAAVTKAQIAMGAFDVYGVADEVWKLICTKYPALREVKPEVEQEESFSESVTKHEGEYEEIEEGAPQLG